MEKRIITLLEDCNKIFLGKERVIKLSLAAILAKGHILLEDIPGVGKTTLVNLLAKFLGLPLNRIQLTSDLLPADILGNLIFNSETGKFEVYKGPIFSNLILADELNRATPKTQSAFLQAMEDGTVSIDKDIFELPKPFMIFATQNPKEQIGTFPLPESQLDRFLMKISIGHPDEASERLLLSGEKRKDLMKNLSAHFTKEEVLQMQNVVKEIFVSEAIISYVQRILQKSRSPEIQKAEYHTTIYGLSPRAGISIIDAAKGWAYIHGRKHLLPDDVQAIVSEVIIHRMIPEHGALASHAKTFVKNMIESIPVD